MSTEVRKRTGVNCCLVVVLALQSSIPSLALPVIQPGARPERQESCITVHANLSSVQDIPDHIVRLLSQRQVQSEFALQLPLKETYPREEGSPEGDGKVKIGGGASFVLCQGEWPHKPSPPNALKLYGTESFKDSPNQPRSGEYQHAALYLLLSSETLDEMSLRNNVLLTLTCSKSPSYCYNIVYNSVADMLTSSSISSSLDVHSNQSPRASSRTRLIRRSAGNSYGSHDTHLSKSDATLVVAVIVAVVSLIVIIALVALCAGSSTNDRQETAGAITLQKSASEAPSSEVTVQLQPPKAVHVEVDIEMKSEPAAATNGAVRDKAAATDRQQLSPSHRDSLNPPPVASPQREMGSDGESRSRTLSARSFDPLPEIPKLDTAEDDKDQRSKENPPSRGEGGGDDEDDEAGYAYARVGGAAVNGMDEAESDKEDKAGGDDARQGSNLPPYGKVSHHVTKAKVRETEEYAEVKEVFRGPAAIIAANRGRSATDPIDPKEAGVDGVRDKRALTHTHMMPLPAVPTQPITVDDNEMYDSIPDDMRDSQVPQPQASAPAARPRPKERLYESMDEVEDTYESVPDNLKPDSPLAASPVSPSHPTKLPLPGSSTSPPLPPPSPVPKPQPKETEKKGLEKTLSASQAEGDGKRRFSFFGRKKTASVSGVTSKKKEKEKHADKEHKDHHHVPHQPLPDVPTLSPVKSPPLPPIPANDDENDTMYDTPQLDFMSSPSRVSPGPPPPVSPSEAKAKSQSLPSIARGAGATVFHGPRVNIPLPRVPEDSGQGVVVRERVMESPQKGEEDKPYDSVKILTDTNEEKPYDSVRVLDGLEDINEPNYDTVDKEEIFKVVAEAEGAKNEPGYDRVRQIEEVGGEGQGERERVPTPEPNEGEGSAAGVNGIRYGR